MRPKRKKSTRKPAQAIAPVKTPDISRLRALIQAGDLSAAETFAGAQIDQHGRVPEFLQPMGEIRLRRGRNADALPWLEAACTAQPGNLDAWNQRALVLSRLQRFAEAHEAYLQALPLAPQAPALYANIGANLNKAERFREAEQYLRQGLALAPNAADLQTNLANALIGQDRIGEARTLVNALLQKGERGPQVLLAHASLLQAAGKFAEAEALIRPLWAADPQSHTLRLLLATVLGSLSQQAEQIALLQAVLTSDPDAHAVHSNLIFTLNYAEDTGAADLLTHAQRYGRTLQTLHTAQGAQPYAHWLVDPHPTRLRVGLVSGDFRNHPIGYFLEAAVPALQARRIELIAYPTLPEEDELTERIRPHFARWQPLVGLDDAQAAQQIHRDGVHVLVDLSGHTAGHRLPVFALKPAPVQATWLGYLGTTGVTEIDWVMADPHIAPEGTEAEFVEGIWRLPESYAHLSPPAHVIDVAPLPALTSGHITFGSFNNLAKMTDAVVALWARVLHAVPKSRLFLKYGQLQDAAVVQRTLTRYGAHGIGPERLVLEGPSSRAAALAAYHRVDIALDTFPYNGGTTSLEALWMSVPVLTLRGSRFMARMGVTLMAHAGLPDWIADDPNHFVQLAVAHSRDLHALARVRAGLRAQVLASPLMNTPRFAQAVEAAWWGMWQHWQASAPPEAIREPEPVPATHTPPPLADTWDEITAQIERGEHQTAWPRLMALIETYPEHAPLHRLQGGLLEQSGRWAEAQPAFRRALTLDPHDGQAHAGLAGCLHRQGALPEALTHFRAAVQAQCEAPRHVTAPPPPATPFDVQAAEATLWQVLAQLAKAGVHAFATSGTLLGLVREGQLLSFDKDLDVGLPFAEMAAASACLQAAGWQRKLNMHGLVNPQEWHKDGVALDLCGLAPDPAQGALLGGFWFESPTHPWSRVTVYPELKLQSTRRPGGRVWALADPEAVLVALYGPHWRTPDPDFDTVIAAHNLRGFSVLTQCYAFARIYTTWLRGETHKTRALVRHSLRHMPEDELLRRVAEVLGMPDPNS